MTTTLESLGVGVQTAHRSETFTIAGVSTTKNYQVLTLQLPSEPKVQATFCQEGLGKKILKLFKKEIQVGDAVFDKAVYITTETPDATKAFLAPDDIQTTILGAVMSGGHIEIRGRVMTATMVRADGDATDPGLVRFVQALLSS
ncbi:MAG: hypothetical protein HY908_24790 [Myxococcales bacterium]|nr:hypothetical protein [Myxococcales bacterium]